MVEEIKRWGVASQCNLIIIYDVLYISLQMSNKLCRCSLYMCWTERFLKLRGEVFYPTALHVLFSYRMDGKGERKRINNVCLNKYICTNIWSMCICTGHIYACVYECVYLMHIDIFLMQSVRSCAVHTEWMSSQSWRTSWASQSSWCGELICGLSA